MGEQAFRSIRHWESREHWARQLIAKMVLNGIYLPFMIWGQFWAPQFRLVALQYPPFSNLQRCFSFWKVKLTMVVYGSVRVNATFCFIAGGSEYFKMGLPGPFLVFSAWTTIPWGFNLAMCRRKVLCENPTSERSCLNSNDSPFFKAAKICLSKESIIDL